MPPRPQMVLGLVVASRPANLIARCLADAPRDVVGGHRRYPGGRGYGLVPMVAGRAAQVVAEASAVR